MRVTAKILALCLLLAACGKQQVASKVDASESDDPRQRIDLIVEAQHLLTMIENDPVQADAAVAIDKGIIVAVGPRDEINAAYLAGETLSGEHRVVMPGLVNGHTHAAMTLLRGIADDLALMDWLNNFIFPAEVQFVDSEFVRVGTELACWEMIRGGTTTFVDMYYFPDAVANVVERCGLRAIVVPSVIEQTSPDAENGEQSLAQAIDFARRWKGKNSRITPSIGAHSVYTVSLPWLKRVRDAAVAENVPISIHLSESQFEMDVTAEKHDMTPIELLESIDFFSAKVIGAHVVYPTLSDQRLLARRKVGAIHNPTSNMKIASGISPVTDMLANGVLVGLGTDGAASNNDLDMWEEIRLAAFLAKVSTMDPTALPALTVLELATRRGAEAIGLSHQVGTLQPGMRADLIQVSMRDLSFVPVYNVVSHLAYVADEHDVVSTVVDGKVLMRDRIVLSLNADKIRREANQFRDRIIDGLDSVKPLAH